MSKNWVIFIFCTSFAVFYVIGMIHANEEEIRELNQQHSSSD